jgi:hypothetical protein
VELSWLMKLRIAAVIATGVILIGILAWPLAAPHDPLGAVRFSNLSYSGTAFLVLLAFWAGFIAYFISWPYGREMGVLSVPSGLAVWAGRTGNVAELMQLNSTLSQRQALFASFKWEPFFWLLIIAAGFAGVFLGQKIWPNPHKIATHIKNNPKPTKYYNAIAALIGSALIAHLCIIILAQDFRTSNNTIVAQPAIGQIIFAVLVSFGLASFIVSKLLKSNFIWPIIASAFVTMFAVTIYAKQNVLQTFLENWPATFFSSPVISILPLQMVAFGTLGSITGYWLAIRHGHHQKHERK